MSIAFNSIPPRPRDLRLDFFRGLAMFAIYIGHVPMNAWADYMPGRFGFSDAAEVFVFCSGIASAIAFGRIFDKHGFAVGSGRVAFRCWQVYWAHISIFFVALTAMIAVDKVLGTGTDYVRGLNLLPFLQDTGTNLLSLMTLTYIPNMFDILPMYLVLLALIPLAMALEKLGRIYVLGAVMLAWLAANLNYIELSAEPWSNREWFFNPFAWQLVFFTGFGLVRGWLPVPPVNTRLMIAAAVIVVVTIPFAYWPLVKNVDVLKGIHKTLTPLTNKTHCGVLRYIHFVSAAYLAYSLAGVNSANLKGRFVRICEKVGQHALATFMAGLLLSLLSGVALNLLGRNFMTFALVNLSGCAILLAVAYIAEWFKSAPLHNRVQVAGEHIGGAQHTLAAEALRATGPASPVN